MLNKPIEEIVVENGKVVGVKSEGEVSILFLKCVGFGAKHHLESSLRHCVIFDVTKTGLGVKNNTKNVDVARSFELKFILTWK